MTEFEGRWREFISTKFDGPLDCFKCPDERGAAEAMCTYCGKALTQTSALFVSKAAEQSQ